MVESGRKCQKGGGMFIGEYHHSVDTKGRVTIPTKFRDELGETFYITKGFDACLFVFSEKEWGIFLTKLQNIKLKSKDARRIQRFFLSSSIECSLDKQGRALLSIPQRDYATIKKEVAIIGVSDRLEIWDKELWQSYMENDADDISDLADSMEELEL